MENKKTRVRNLNKQESKVKLYKWKKFIINRL